VTQSRGSNRGSPFFGYFLWRSKESNWPPRHKGQSSCKDQSQIRSTNP
jgi:hypothetical protein